MLEIIKWHLHGSSSACRGNAGDEAANEDVASKAKQEQQYYQDLLANLARIKDQVRAAVVSQHRAGCLVVQSSVKHCLLPRGAG
eukprot:1151952-Pelagomonas_calceolata.AAC.6